MVFFNSEKPLRSLHVRVGGIVASVVLLINAHHTAGKQLERLADGVGW